MTTEQRLERLERKVRWMRRIGAVGVAVIAAVLLIGQGRDKVFPDLKVRSLRVMDRKGNTRVRLHTWGLSLNDEDDKTRARLSVTGGAPALGFSDKSGQSRFRVVMYPDGSPAVWLSDKSGKTRTVLGAAKTGETKTAENTLTLYDAKGKVIWKAPKD